MIYILEIIVNARITVGGGIMRAKSIHSLEYSESPKVEYFLKLSAVYLTMFNFSLHKTNEKRK